MLYSAYITYLRKLAGDSGTRSHTDWTGNGTDTAYQMPLLTFPVLESSYTVKVAGTPQTETTHYTLDKQTGLITFVTAPTNGQAVSIDNTAVKMTDASWVDMINATIRSLGNDFWKEVVDTSLTATANMTTLDCSSITGLFQVFDVATRSSSTADWTPVTSFGNLRYSQDENKLYFSSRNLFTTTGDSIRIKGLKTYAIGDETTDTLDVQDRFLPILDAGTLERFYKSRIPEMVESLGKITQEGTRTSLQELVMIIDRFNRSYETEKARLKPMKPAYTIPVKHPGQITP